MTVLQLYEKLKQLKIPDNWYFLHGLYGSTDDNDKISLLIKQGYCEVYFKEYGQRTTDLRFETETEACMYVFKKLKTELMFHKANTIKDLERMTVNERLFASDLMTDFDVAKKDNKQEAKFILRLLKVDEESINKIVK